MRIIGIDPGTATTGYSIVENNAGKVHLLDYGCIKTKASRPADRHGLPANLCLQQLSEDLISLVKKWQPQLASIEKLFFQKNIKTAMSVSEARGVIIHTLTNLGLQINEFTPLEIKSAVCGYGKADKKMIQQMIKIIFGMKIAPKQDDAADAIAAAICLANSLALKQAILA